MRPGTSSSTRPPIFSSARRSRRDSSVSSDHATAGDDSTRLAEILAAQHEQVRIFHRDHVRRARPVVDERQLAEVLADAEHAEDDLAPVFTDEHDLDASLAHDEQRVAGIVLEENDAALRVRLSRASLRANCSSSVRSRPLKSGTVAEKIDVLSCHLAHEDSVEARRRRKMRSEIEPTRGVADQLRRRGTLAF